MFPAASGQTSHACLEEVNVSLNQPCAASAYIVLRPRNSRAAPFDCVSTPHEASESVGRGFPRHPEFHFGRVGRRIDVGVENGSAGNHLLQLAICDSELRGVDRVTKDCKCSGVNRFRPEVLVEVGVLLHQLSRNLPEYDGLSIRTTARMKL